MPREFHPPFAAEPFRCVHSGTDFGPAALDEHADFVDRWGNRLGGAMLLRLYFGMFTIPHLDALYEAIDAEVAGADLLVAHPAASMVGAMAAERHGVPWLVGDLFPMLLPSEHAPMAGMPYLGRAGEPGPDPGRPVAGRRPAHLAARPSARTARRLGPRRPTGGT